MVRTIRLGDERIAEILDELDRNDASIESGRQMQRYPYRVRALVVHMQQPGFPTPVPFLVPGRNISATGSSFLHGGFVHPGTRCLLQVITTGGTWTNAGGTVVRCRLVHGNVHEVGVQFDKEIDPAVYCADAMRSRVLLVEDDTSIARLARFHLEQLHADVDLARNGEEAVDLALHGHYDLILMDVELPVMNGLEAVKRLRSHGYTGTIAAATAMTRPEDAEECLAAGCDRYFPKPFSRAELADLLTALRQEPLFSSFHDEASMKGLVREFVSELPGRLRRLHDAIATEDSDTIRSMVRLLKVEGTSYGFDTITEAAEGVEQALLAGETLSEVKEGVEALSKLCSRVRAPKESAPPPRMAPANVGSYGDDVTMEGAGPTHQVTPDDAD